MDQAEADLPYLFETILDPKCEQLDPWHPYGQPREQKTNEPAYDNTIQPN
jgi:hypothetical protein